MICIKMSLHRRELGLSPLDAVFHLLGLLVPAFGLGAISAGLAKLAWRAELRAVRYRRLAGWSTGAAAAALLTGLVAFGRDGMMATYAAMVIASALALLWSGFVARR